MRLNNKTYDALKYIVVIAIPAISTLYAAISKIWGIPYTTEVTGTLSTVATFLGAMICISTSEYNKDRE